MRKPIHQNRYNERYETNIDEGCKGIVQTKRKAFPFVPLTSDGASAALIQKD